jgi:hypothetical protein
VDRRGFCFGATLALTAFACSSGSGGPGDSRSVSETSGAAPLAQTAALGGRNVSSFERSGSPALPEDSAPEHVGSCGAFTGSGTAHLSVLLGQSLVARRGALLNAGDTCSLFGDGVRVRLVSVAAFTSDASAQLKCHELAGPTAQFLPTAGAMSWQSADGVFTAQGGQCVWTQVYTNGSLDSAASRSVALDTARRAAMPAVTSPSGQ